MVKLAHLEQFSTSQDSWISLEGSHESCVICRKSKYGSIVCPFNAQPDALAVGFSLRPPASSHPQHIALGNNTTCWLVQKTNIFILFCLIHIFYWYWPTYHVWWVGRRYEIGRLFMVFAQPLLLSWHHFWVSKRGLSFPHTNGALKNARILCRIALRSVIAIHLSQPFEQIPVNGGQTVMAMNSSRYGFHQERVQSSCEHQLPQTQANPIIWRQSLEDPVDANKKLSFAKWCVVSSVRRHPDRCERWICWLQARLDLLASGSLGLKEYIKSTLNPTERMFMVSHLVC